MNFIADALVYAVTYINVRGGDDDLYDDSDVKALESIGRFLKTASVAEEDALAAAAERALAKELVYPSREAFIRDYEKWAEEMLGEGWEGNKRVNQVPPASS